MKYFNYFRRKAMSYYSEIENITPTRIELKSGKILEYDFSELLSYDIDNSNYRHEIHQVVLELKDAIESELNESYVSLIKKIGEKLKGMCSTIEIIEDDAHDKITIVDNLRNIYRKDLREDFLLRPEDEQVTEITNEFKQFINIVE